MNKIKTRVVSKWVVLVMSSMMLAISVGAQSSKEGKQDDGVDNIFELLSKDDVLEIKIIVDIDSLINTKNSDEYHTAIIQNESTNGQRPGWQVKLRARGKYRKRICDMPPLKINFNKSDFKSENLRSHKSLKLVTHCNDLEGSEELILKEYLTYKTYNVITDQSLRVQLVKIEWMDSGGNHDIGKKWGFLIENEDEMAQRVGADLRDIYAIEKDSVDAKSGAVSSLFQYMIGNPDWNLSPMKNMCLIKSTNAQGLIPVPYDFDFCGVVEAPYAVSQYKLTSMKERIYLGDSSDENIEKAKDHFKAKKDEIIKEIKSFEHIKNSTRREILSYIRSFYSNIKKPLRLKKYYDDRFEKRQ